jgi:hypothetical protein
MNATAPDIELTDDEWREQKFSPEELIAARLMGEPPPFAALKECITRFGPDGVLETAILLPRAQYEKLEQIIKKQPKQPPYRPRRRHR